MAYSEPATVIPYAITWEFTYDANGMRTGRTNGTVTYSYLYNGSQLTQMTRDGMVMRFSYGTDGRPLVISYNDTPYYYITNLQGDVIAIMDSYGTTVVKYTYDAWGHVTITKDVSYINLGEINPLRYRGYVYDQETGLYYLQSRYYNPTWGRFINADNYTSTGQGLTGNNMFVYCGNNPINVVDPTGEAGLFIFANAVFGAVIGAGAKIFNNLATGQDAFDGVAGAALGGAVYNVVAITTGNIGLASFAGSATEATVNEAMNYVTGEKKLTADNLMGSAASIITTTAVNTLTTAAAGKVASNIIKTNAGWFQPQKLISSFTGKYAQRVLGQTTVQAAMIVGHNVVQYWATELSN